MKKILLLSISFLPCLCGFGFDGNGSVQSGGINRTFVFHAPGNAVAQNLPLVIVMHGDGGTGAGIKGYAGFDAVSDAQNFIAVYPDAVNSSWNRYVDDVPGDAGLGNPNAPDDVLFISQLIDYFCDTYGANTRKVYAAGHSAGGFMAYNLAIQLPNKVAAFAPIAGSLWGDNTFVTNHFTNNYVQVPIYHIHGDADNVVTYPDPDHTPGAYAEWPLSGFSMPNCNQNSYTATNDLVAGVKELVFCDGLNTNGKKVSLVRIVGGGHGWPNVNGYNAASAIWDFMKVYELGTNAACASLSIENNFSDLFQIFPNPSSDRLFITHTTTIDAYSIKDVTGRNVYQHTNLINQIDISHLQAGVYFLTLISNGKAYTTKFAKE